MTAAEQAAAVAVEWQVVHVGKDETDDDGQRIAPGWYVFGIAPGEPESVYVQLHVEFAIDADGRWAGEHVARQLVSLLESTPGVVQRGDALDVAEVLANRIDARPGAGGAQ